MVKRGKILKTATILSNKLVSGMSKNLTKKGGFFRAAKNYDCNLSCVMYEYEYSTVRVL